MNAIKAADDGSTGASETSAFHQFSAGNAGAAPRTAAPSAGRDAGHSTTPPRASAIDSALAKAIIAHAAL
jgi:hypothetical protein